MLERAVGVPSWVTLGLSSPLPALLLVHAALLLVLTHALPLEALEAVVLLLRLLRVAWRRHAHVHLADVHGPLRAGRAHGRLAVARVAAEAAGGTALHTAWRSACTALVHRRRRHGSHGRGAAHEEVERVRSHWVGRLHWRGGRGGRGHSGRCGRNGVCQLQAHTPQLNWGTLPLQAQDRVAYQPHEVVVEDLGRRLGL